MDEQDPPRVSVVMPVRNAESVMHPAIDSILKQTFRNFEFLIVNDNSTDRTREVLEHYQASDSRIKLFENTDRRGVAAALDLAIQHARGTYLARMDADDWSAPSRLEEQVEYLDSHPSVTVCGSYIEICDGQLHPLRIRRYHEHNSSIKRNIFVSSPFCHSAICMRRDVVQKTSGYATRFELAEDYYLYFQLGKLGEFANIPKVLHKLRVHEESYSSRNSFKQEMMSLRVRLEAILRLGYPMTPRIIGFIAAQSALMILLPSKAKRKLFHSWRNR